MYSVTSRAFHWTMAGLMTLAFTLVWVREDLPKGDLRTSLLSWHMAAGLMVLALLLPRLLARLVGTTAALVRDAIATTRGSSMFSTAVPPTGNDSISSPFARATSSSDPNVSRWAPATIVTRPTVGRATRQSRSMWPGPRAPISTTAASVPSGALARVSGTPSSLLKDAALAVVA